MKRNSKRKSMIILRPERRDGKNIKCKNCGISFYISKCHIGRRKYCSKQCMHEWIRRNSGSIRLCKTCGKKFYKKGNPLKTKTGIYCSRKCFIKTKKTGKLIKCKTCDKEVYKQACFLKKNKNLFCNIKCAQKYQKRNQIEFICKICKNKFKLSKSRVQQREQDKNEVLYCSWECRLKDKEHMKLNSIRGNLAQFYKRGLNKLELEGRNILINLGLELNKDFKEQVLIKNKFLVDIYIKNKNLIIQWDGDYWHGNPNLYNIFSKHQIKRKGNDKGQNKYLEKCGYKILRFWEFDIKNNKGVVIENIKRAIQ